MKKPIAQKMDPLPLGQLRPEGWLREQVSRTIDGFFGHLTDISGYLTEENAWLRYEKTFDAFRAEPGNGGKPYQAFGWEEQAYWLRGAYKLALVSRDRKMTELSARYIRALLDSACPDGWFGPAMLRDVEPDTPVPMPDIWPHMVMADVLWDYWRNTGDRKAVDVLLGFCDFCLKIPDEVFMPGDYTRLKGGWYAYIQTSRVCEMVPVLNALAEETGEEAPVRLAERFFKVFREHPAAPVDRHVVNFAQRIKYTASQYPITGDEALLRECEAHYLEHMAEWGQMPGGLYAADENTRPGKTDPRQGTETCALSEIVKSFNYIASVTGETLYGDRVEDVMFNSYPASHTADYGGLHYLTANNLPELDALAHDYCNKGKQTEYDPFDYRCCQHNTGAGWPNFISSLFFTKGNTLTAWCYAPCALRTCLESGRVCLRERTEYPFREEIRLESLADGSYELRLRIPGWAESHSLSLDGKAVDGKASNGLLSLTVPAGSHVVTLRLPQTVRTRKFALNGNCVCLDRGPLTYSLRLREAWTVAERKTDRAGRVWDVTDVRSASPFNYALDLSVPVTVEERPVFSQPFTPESAPLLLTVTGRRLPGWGIGEERTVMPVPASPVRTEEKAEKLIFVPQGCMRARMTCFPWTE